MLMGIIVNGKEYKVIFGFVLDMLTTPTVARVCECGTYHGRNYLLQPHEDHIKGKPECNRIIVDGTRIVVHFLGS